MDIPEDVSESWYRGQVTVTLKDAAFEPSSPMRHTTKLSKLLEGDTKPILFLYSDGGPDHCVTYISVQTALIALFRGLDLDYLCAARTAPCHSWRNLVERVMSTINLGMQCVSLIKKGSHKYEKEAKSAKVLLISGKLYRGTPVSRKSLDSVAPVKILLSVLFQRLELKKNKFKIGVATSDSDIEEMWGNVTTIDPSVDPKETLNKGNLSLKPQLVSFLNHCSRQRHYCLEIQKCGESSYTICKPVRLPDDVFVVRHLPDPTPSSDGPCEPFADIFGKEISESH